jgi:hypothetical protein
MSEDLLSIEKIEIDLNTLINEFFNANTKLKRFGIFDPMDVQAIYKSSSYLFNPETLDFISSSHHYVPMNKLRLIKKILLEYSSLYHNFVDFYSSQSRIQSAKVKLADKKRYTLAELQKMFLNEDDREKRRIFHSKYYQKSQKLYQVYEKILVDVFNNAKINGYCSIFEMVQENNFCNYSKLKKSAESFLKQSTKQYLSQLEYFLQTKMKICLDQASQADVWALIEGKWLGYHDFSYTSLLENIDDITDQMNLNFSNVPNFHFDLEDRANKSIYATLAFEWIKNIKHHTIILNSSNLNIKNLKTFVHELGHAIHYLNMDPNLSQMFLSVGEMETTETIAYLFENLLKNINFLDKFYPSKIENLQDYLKFLNFTKFHWSRLFAVKFLHHYELFNQKINYTKQSFEESRLFFDNMFIKYFNYDRMSYDHFKISNKLLESAHYLRAFMIEPQLTKYLEKKPEGTKKS